MKDIKKLLKDNFKELKSMNRYIAALIVIQFLCGVALIVISHKL